MPDEISVSRAQREELTQLSIELLQHAIRTEFLAASLRDLLWQTELLVKRPAQVSDIQRED